MLITECYKQVRMEPCSKSTKTLEFTCLMAVIMLETVGQLVHYTISGQTVSFTVIHICVNKDNFLQQGFPVPKGIVHLSFFFF